MGWSCTHEQHESLTRIQKAMSARAPVGSVGSIFVESPRGGPYGKHYGFPGANVICLPVYEITSPNHGRRLGYCRIGPDGRFSLPLGLRRKLNL